MMVEIVPQHHLARYEYHNDIIYAIHSLIPNFKRDRQDVYAVREIEYRPLIRAYFVYYSLTLMEANPDFDW